MVELKHGNWTPAEDAILVSLMALPTPPTWLEIAEAHFPDTRNANQLRHRWADVLKHGGRRKSGSTSRRRSAAADVDGTKQRARRRPGRPKQTFAHEDDETILQLHDEVGLSFESIERDYFSQRSTGAVEARYNKLTYHSSSPPPSPPRGPSTRPTRKSLPAPRQVPKKQNKSFPPPERTNDLFYDGPLGEAAPSSDCAEAGRTLVLMRSKSFDNEKRFLPPQAQSKPHPRAALSPIKPRTLAPPSATSDPRPTASTSTTPPCPLHFLATHASSATVNAPAPNASRITYSLTPFVPLPPLSFSQSPDAPFEEVRKKLCKELRVGEGEVMLVDEKGERVGWEETPEGRGMKGGEGWSVGVRA